MNTGTATLEHSLVSANTGNVHIQREDGGGIANSRVPCAGNFMCNGLATMSITNSTISGNVSKGNGGGIDNNAGDLVWSKNCNALLRLHIEEHTRLRGAET
jgi:hypothetical protein